MYRTKNTKRSSSSSFSRRQEYSETNVQFIFAARANKLHKIRWSRLCVRFMNPTRSIELFAASLLRSLYIVCSVSVHYVAPQIVPAPHTNRANAVASSWRWRAQNTACVSFGYVLIRLYLSLYARISLLHCFCFDCCCWWWCCVAFVCFAFRPSLFAVTDRPTVAYGLLTFRQLFTCPRCSSVAVVVLACWRNQHPLTRWCYACSFLGQYH